MTKEELVLLAAKIKEGTASDEEAQTFLKELSANVIDLNNFLSTLPKTS